MYKFMLNETSYHGAGAIKAVPEEIKNQEDLRKYLLLLTLI